MIERIVCILEYLKYQRIVLSQAEFSEKIGIKPSQLSEMMSGKRVISERTVHKISDAFPMIDAKWLLSGEGEMLKPPKNQFSQMTEQEIESITGETIAEELMKLLKSGEVFLAATHHKIVDEKNEEIAKLYLRLEKSQRENWELQRKIDELTR